MNESPQINHDKDKEQRWRKRDVHRQVSNRPELSFYQPGIKGRVEILCFSITLLPI